MICSVSHFFILSLQQINVFILKRHGAVLKINSIIHLFNFDSLMKNRLLTLFAAMIYKLSGICYRTASNYRRNEYFRNQRYAAQPEESDSENLRRKRPPGLPGPQQYRQPARRYLYHPLRKPYAESRLLTSETFLTTEHPHRRCSVVRTY